MSWYTIYGFWARTGERFAGFYEATSARAAEDLAQMDAAEKHEVLRVAHVAGGQVCPVDRYTLYVDPQDPRNEGEAELEPDVPDFTAGDPEWTVLGLAMPEGWAYDDPRIAAHGERYGDVVNATSPLAAEDVARDRLHERHGQLLVCAVLPGSVGVADGYATFADPDVELQKGK